MHVQRSDLLSQMSREQADTSQTKVRQTMSSLAAIVLIAHELAADWKTCMGSTFELAADWKTCMGSTFCMSPS